MASGGFSRLSVTLCLFLCCYVSSGGCCSRKCFAKNEIDAKDVYYVSQVISKPEILEKFPQTRSHSTALSGPVLLLSACKLLRRATIVIAFISLADDLNPGPGDFNMDTLVQEWTDKLTNPVVVLLRIYAMACRIGLGAT